MGWRTEEGYYQKHVEVEGFANKITEEQKAFNKLSPEEVREGIEIAQQQYLKDSKNTQRDYSKTDKLKAPYSKTRETPIEYIIEELDEAR